MCPKQGLRAGQAFNMVSRPSRCRAAKPCCQLYMQVEPSHSQCCEMLTGQHDGPDDNLATLFEQSSCSIPKITCAAFIASLGCSSCRAIDSW